ncbi:MAG: glycosyltransferase family 2 protein [Bacteroidales bacterium]|nr:glycosyltransferase family 2 protein [Bacteroidales bacterium]
MAERKNKTLIIIPAYNEAWNIVNVIFEIHEQIRNCDILVVNDASTDSTGNLAEKTGVAEVLNFPYNLGIGAAVQAGFKYANIYNYKYALQFDGDGQHLTSHIPMLINEIETQKCDVVVGSRFIGESSKFDFKSTFLRRIGIRIFTFITILLIQKRITDCTSGFRIYNRKAIKFLAKHYPADYPEPEAIILLGKNGFTFAEVPTKMRARQGGVSSISQKGFFYMIKVLLSMFMTVTRPKIKINEPEFAVR